VDADFAEILYGEGRGSGSDSRQVLRKTQQFCCQVQRALNLALADSNVAGIGCELFVDEVSPAPGHGERELWVHRKGAMSAQQGQTGVLPGSMGSPSFHVKGRGCEQALCSSAHGAGRALSRGAARSKFSDRDFQRQMEGVWYDYRLKANSGTRHPLRIRTFGRSSRHSENL
jgi:hypothetical protein